ncbi:membrane protein insertion efficiency factor YidD [Pseudomonas sp. FP1154]|uniref:membrane protein insertion efficiency factor YidD n=1 Tax=Pseudomonas sp. FP1154 TaxID=2954077 RepID=UPI00351DF38C
MLRRVNGEEKRAEPLLRDFIAQAPMIKLCAVSAIRCYQRVAPSRLRDACRFEPSCSNYAIQAIEKYGVLNGCRMAVGRICRCRYPNGGKDFP